MVKWFKNLSDANKIAIFVPVCLAVIGGLFGLFKLFEKQNVSTSQQNTIRQEGSSHTATTIDGDKNIIAGGDVHIGIKPDSVLDRYEITLKQLGQSEEKIKNQRETIRQLEEQLSQSQMMADAGRQQVPQPTQEAKDLAAQIQDDAGPYALALKAIATGSTEQADELLDNTQKLLDKVQEQKDRAQAKIYMARMQNAYYAGRSQNALQYCDKLTTLAGNDSLIINNMAAVYYENAKYKEAEPLMHRALKIDEAALGKDHPDVARDLNNLAALYRETNRLKEAEPLMQRVVKIFEKSLGENHPNVATALNNLAALYKATNRLKQAEPLMKRALAIDEAALGKDHPKVATDLNNLAELLRETGRFEQAEPMYKRALEIWEKSLGKEHPQVAKALSNLALVYQETNRLKKAEPLTQRALKIHEAAFGKDHPSVATDLNNLASVYQDTNRPKKAECLYRRALAIDEASLGKDHPNVARDLNNLAELLRKTDRFEEAEPMYKRALKIDEASLGKDHPNVARDLNNLAQLYRATNRLEEVEPLMERVLVILLQFTRRTGHPHPHLSDAINNYRVLLMQMGHSASEVNDRLKRLALEIFESTDKQVKGQ